MPVLSLHRVASVLIVDDDETMLSAFRRRFQSREWEVFTATRGEAAIDLARQHAPTIIWLDLQLSDEWTMALIGPLLGASPTSKIVVVTGHGDIELANEALQLGAKALVEKPTSIDRILKALDLARERTARNASLTQPMAELEREKIASVLKETGGNVAEAARLLGIDRRTLLRKLRGTPRQGRRR